MVRPALDLGITHEGEIRIEDVGRGNGEGDRCGDPATRRGWAEDEGDGGGAAHEDRHLRMDRRLAEPGEAGESSEDETATLDRHEREGDAGGGKDSRPREVGQREHRVERGQLRHPPVERVRLVAEDDRVTQRLDHGAKTEAKGAEEERKPPGGPVFEEVADHQPHRRHQGERPCHPGEMEDDEQGQVQDRPDVPKQNPEHEQVRDRARLRRVAVLPRPSSLPPLAHLGEVGVGVVSQIEEAHEDVARRLDGVRVEVRDGGDGGKGEAGDQGDAPVLPA